MGRSMESITSVKIFHGSEYKANGKVIRWTEVRKWNLASLIPFEHNFLQGSETHCGLIWRIRRENVSVYLRYSNSLWPILALQEEMPPSITCSNLISLTFYEWAFRDLFGLEFKKDASLNSIYHLCCILQNAGLVNAVLTVKSILDNTVFKK